ncbi:hypothetical protein FDP41_012196 [Naegleria fowleri]|uniref:NlpC/P60 domain-containing protein n=1 Tax=Naegleria fowleri TaxID=5763 RepID=A0A6A5C6G1_NAEFO|nr:uncharacterized protein FDP41_012498 [Naegleria fowleri]XP_044566252.1 uncharacterized protein FDP41_012196 [Naegleria fowleri]KAF0981388.1 hypothetical protein FDP41_012498 [Naegleria fowleri]KAF0981539.1 hypothetical protein FDP41_012196 [Naegleria fowleri]CAG4718789.1 unnamed protein product [Naegleria fowleri]
MSRSLLFVLLLSLVLAFTASTQARTVSERAIDSIINTWVNSVTNAKYENEELADTTSSPGQIAAAFANSKTVPTTTRGYPGSLRDVTGQALQTGDILWRSGHVGIYLGGNQVVNAENPKSGVKKRDLGFYTKYLGFTREYRV